ncbi:MAG TPA: P-II family nitrogen regulator [Candidatus Nitrosocosmicus sp.]|jgi:nitrogen regulatory protein P-II 1
MKEINIFIRSDDLSKVTDILQKHNAGITFFNIQGTGRTPRSTTEIIHSYQTGRTIVPKFIGRIMVISIVSDSNAKLILEEIKNSFELQTEPYGVIFIKDVSDAFELGTNLTGDDVLFSK